MEKIIKALEVIYLIAEPLCIASGAIFLFLKRPDIAAAHFAFAVYLHVKYNSK